MSAWQWRDGNDIRLLENGEEYYPAVFAAIASARHEVRIETFILFEDAVGRELEKSIRQAVANGAHVELMVDGYGSERLTPEFVARMQALGVVLRMFEPFPRLFGNRVNLFRRLHRKIVVVDSRVAYIGGMNFSADHLLSTGPKSKQDYAVEVRGPLVDDLRQLTLDALPGAPRRRWWQRGEQQITEQPSGNEIVPMRALLASRDNHHHRDDIERLYLIAIRAARSRIVIANAYFFPGYRLLRALRRASARGVRVDLILQGNPDMPVARFITQTLYSHLARAGVEIYEYCERPIHAKVAVIDGEWSTVGSSNLDPLSLALNLEANLFIADAGFARTLLARLDGLIAHSCQRPDPQRLRNPTLIGVVLGFIAYHASRHFPRVANWLPRRRPALHLMTEEKTSLPAPKRMRE